MTLLRQGSRFLVVGMAQLALDWATFVIATSLGMPAVPGNLLGRLCGMLLGFWLNGRYTFSQDDGARLGWTRFWKFLAIWLLATVLSTWLILLVEHHLGLRLAWLAKPLVEGGLAVLTFLAGRYVVYR